MKNLFTILFLCFSVTLIGQSACDNLLVNFENDEPPGCSLCGSLVESRTLGYMPDDFSFDFPCGEIENSQWFSLFPKERQLAVGIKVKSCLNGTGIEAAIYDKNFNLVSNCAVKDSIGFGWSINVDNLEDGVLHHLMIDGIDNSDCSFELTVQGNYDRNDLRLKYLTDDRGGKPVCFGGEVCFSTERYIDATTYNWSLTPSSLEILSGGGQKDTFVCTEINAENYICLFNTTGTCERISSGVDFSFAEGTIDTSNLAIIDTIACSAECLPFLDSCYYEEGTHYIIYENRDPLQCDTTYILTIEHEEVFPSPLIECKEMGDALLIEWEKFSGVSEFEIFLNRDSFTTTKNNFVIFENFPIGEPIDLRVQPIGGCTYLPAEITCTPGLSNASEGFLDKNISIYPNPNKGIVNFKTDLKIESVEVFDLTGRLLQKEKTTSFELKNRAPGIYFLKIKTDEGVGVKRVLVSSK